MTLKTKLYLITILPLVLVSLLTAIVLWIQSERFILAEVQAVEQKILSGKQTELENYTRLALTAIEDVYTNEPGGKLAAQTRVKEILNTMDFGEDGYFYVYDFQGVNLVHPKIADYVGQDLWDLEDPTGNKVIQSLIAQARQGGGFHRYIWHKPSTRVLAEKLGYATQLDKWGWMVGTGIYIDDIAREVALIKAEIEKNVQQTAIVMFLITFAAVLIVAGTIIGFRISEQRIADRKLKELTHRIVDVQEEERKRVSSELHDSISQLLVSIRYSLDLAELKSQAIPEAKKLISKSLQILENALNEVRRISKDLRPSVLDDMGLAAAVISLGKEFQEQTGIEVMVTAERCHNRLSNEAKTAVYRVVQEALTNVARHSGARKVSITIHNSLSDLHLQITDDGCGIPEPVDLGTGLGIRNMRERIDTHHGEIILRSRRTGGTEITVRLPWQKQGLEAA
ncbi:MAG: cache domain-containing protein [Stappiaceae bacterium]